MTVPTDEIRWRNASSGQDTCIDLAHTRDLVRDSKNPSGPTLTVDTDALVAAVKAGTFER